MAQIATPLALYKTAVSEVIQGGTAVTAMYGPVAGGFITNPASASDQRIAVPEILFIDLAGSAALAETETTIAIQPGGSFNIPPGTISNVSVNAVTSGHSFSGIVYQAPTPYPPAPQIGTFPPSGPTTLTELGGMASYLYEQYADDDNLQAFVAAFNTLADVYVGWFATILLPIYTNPQIAGPLLDWVAQGLYGMVRPILSSGVYRSIGPFNTYAYNAEPLNKLKVLGPQNVAYTSDDVFKRIMTWNFYKGDGNTFNVRWLKRRVMRFLTAPNGTAPNIDQTYPVSVLYGANIITIVLSTGTRTITGGALFNRLGYNRAAFNSLTTVFQPGQAPLPLASVLKEAVESGALILPFQYECVVSY